MKNEKIERIEKELKDLIDAQLHSEKDEDLEKMFWLVFRYHLEDLKTELREQISGIIEATYKPYEKYSWICPRCKDDALILQRNSVGLYFFCKNCKLDSSNLGEDKKGTKISIYAHPEQQGYIKAYKNLSNVSYLMHIQGDKPGDYQPITNGEWDVKLDDNCGYTTKSQDHAEIISRLIKLEKICNDILEVIE